MPELYRFSLKYAAKIKKTVEIPSNKRQISSLLKLYIKLNAFKQCKLNSVIHTLCCMYLPDFILTSSLPSPY